MKPTTLMTRGRADVIHRGITPQAKSTIQHSLHICYYSLFLPSHRQISCGRCCISIRPVPAQPLDVRASLHSVSVAVATSRDMCKVSSNSASINNVYWGRQTFPHRPASVCLYDLSNCCDGWYGDKRWRTRPVRQ